jgi:hypothetical protein
VVLLVVACDGLDVMLAGLEGLLEGFSEHSLLLSDVLMEGFELSFLML